MFAILQRLLLTLLFLSASTFAADTGWQRSDTNPYAEVRLRGATLQQQPRMLMDIRLASGWKTYWRSPGEGGVAPEIRWENSAVQAQWHWPLPTRFSVSGFTTQGYRGDVTIPIELSQVAEGPLRGVLTLSSCSNVCILSDFPFELPPLTPADAVFQADYARAMGRVPPTEGVTEQLEASWVGNTLQVKAERAAGWDRPALFFDYPPEVMLGEPDIQVKGSMLTARVSATDEWGDKPESQVGHPLSLVIADGDIAQQSHVTLSNKVLAQNTGESFLMVILLALAGGLILNLMPCVLPVLAMKLGSLVQQTGQTQRQTRQQFLASSGGILVSFMLLALMMTLLRLSGQALGWGIQFQSSGFLVVMVLVTFIFSLSLFDLLHLQLPSGLTTRMATQGGNGLSGHFFQGAFATLLATPCSAPFLGTAVAYALTASLPELWLLFLFLGIGMSLPWLAVALMPVIARLLPRPGRWMIHLRTVLGLLLLLTTGWLITLLQPHWGQQIVVIVSSLLLLLLVVLLWRQRDRVRLVLLPLVLLVAAAAWHFSPQPDQGDRLPWQPLTEGALQQARAKGGLVFVDVTADWCITCKVNKLRVLNQPEVRAALLAPNVTLLQGDWTRPDPAISEFLRQRNLAAIPFNQLYSPAHPDGHIFSPLLNTEDLLTELNSNKAKK